MASRPVILKVLSSFAAGAVSVSVSQHSRFAVRRDVRASCRARDWRRATRAEPPGTLDGLYHMKSSARAEPSSATIGEPS
jgi:hypothetical protein